MKCRGKEPWLVTPKGDGGWTMSGGATANFEGYCTTCGATGRRAMVCHLEQRRKDVAVFENEFLTWLETEFGRKDLGPAAIVRAYSNAVGGLRLLGENGYSEMDELRDALCPEQVREAAHVLFQRTMREIIRRLLDGRLTYEEGSTGFELLNMCVAAVGSEAVEAALDAEAVPS